jgi:hypothetical protein
MDCWQLLLSVKQFLLVTESTLAIEAKVTTVHCRWPERIESIHILERAGERAWQFWQYSRSGGCGAERKAS